MEICMIVQSQINNVKINDELMQFVYKHVNNAHAVPKRQTVK